jgi:hypothetical protein
VILGRPVGIAELVRAIDDALLLRAARLTHRSARRVRAAE